MMNYSKSHHQNKLQGNTGKMPTFSITEIHLKMSSAKNPPFYPEKNILTLSIEITYHVNNIIADESIFPAIITTNMSQSLNCEDMFFDEIAQAICTMCTNKNLFVFIASIFIHIVTNFNTLKPRQFGRHSANNF